MPTRSRKFAPKMASALASADNRAKAALSRLEALESDNAGPDRIDLIDDDEASLDDEDDVYIYKKQPKSMKRKTRQAEALEKQPGRSWSFCTRQIWKHCHPHVPTYLKAAFGPLNF